MATYYVTAAAAGGGTGAIGDPWTLEEACDNVAANDTVYVKADNDYTVEYDTGGAKNCIMYLVTNGALATPITWIGYHTNPGDGGVVTLDASVNGLNFAIDLHGMDYQIFENFVFANGASRSISATGSTYCIFKNCSAEGATSEGGGTGS